MDQFNRVEQPQLPAMRHLVPLLVLALAACAHTPASDPQADATAECMGIAARNGVAIGGAPVQDTAVAGSEYVLGEKAWPATASRGAVLCTLRDGQVQSVAVGDKTVWRRR